MENFVKRFGEPVYLSSTLFQPGLTVDQLSKLLTTIWDSYIGFNNRLTTYIIKQITKQVKHKYWNFKGDEESYAISAEVDVKTIIEFPLDIAFLDEDEVWDTLDLAAEHFVKDGNVQHGYMHTINVRECTVSIEKATVDCVTIVFKCNLLC